MTRLLTILTAIFVLCASQFCVAERIHDHDGAPQGHHHHHDHSSTTDSSGSHDPSHEDDCGDACFERITPSLPRLMITAISFDFVVTPGLHGTFASLAQDAFDEEPIPICVERALESMHVASSISARRSEPNAPPVSLV